MGQALSLPSAHLAVAVAVEWDAVGGVEVEMEADFFPSSSSSRGDDDDDHGDESNRSMTHRRHVLQHITPTQMPLMTLSCTALDQTSAQMNSYRTNIMRFLRTDTTCYWADPMTDRVLYKRQQDAWEPLHNMVKSVTGHELAKAIGHEESMLMSRKTGGAMGLPYHPDVVHYCTNFVHSLDAWHLTAMHSIASEAKSCWMAWALLLNGGGGAGSDSTQDGKVDNPYLLDLTMAVNACRVEEEFQISNWGLVEGGHDYDRLNASAQIVSAVLLKDCIRNSYRTTAT